MQCYNIISLKACGMVLPLFNKAQAEVPSLGFSARCCVTLKRKKITSPLNKVSSVHTGKDWIKLGY